MLSTFGRLPAKLRKGKHDVLLQCPLTTPTIIYRVLPSVIMSCWPFFFSFHLQSSYETFFHSFIFRHSAKSLFCVLFETKPFYVVWDSKNCYFPLLYNVADMSTASSNAPSIESLKLRIKKWFLPKEWRDDVKVKQLQKARVGNNAHSNCKKRWQNTYIFVKIHGNL